ncbi:hypothetical protein ES288_D10G088800v1 [Gossypium darwinii]|uniref:Uncharacterized protein n=1 Tax=Gossypium darwinii TaxID=34276 RepID=A0A5D2B1J3_GOSDA|nr:hypothetical protein ES288_D10G088800v1 [Gossypium darwinii]
MSKSHNFFLNCTIILGAFLCILMVDEGPITTTDKIITRAITPPNNHVFINRAGQKDTLDSLNFLHSKHTGNGFLFPTF